mmetsp:Transcript_19421/g.36245  ORF Transcript_19421/g.36245 Transcript_19421/m.36245 type:complete len:115 (+) Transcript_19421:121-465(+)
MSIPAGPKLEFIEAAETTISVQFKPLSSIVKYELQWKEVEKEWTNPSGSTTVSATNGQGNIKAEINDLNPGMTYCIRAVCLNSSSKGAPGPDLIIDTEQVGCTPKAEKSCCTIQ